jgi:hypothetical protein
VEAEPPTESTPKGVGSDEMPGSLRAVLRPNEILLWHGEPDSSVTFAEQDIFREIFAALYVALALTGLLVAIVAGAPPSFQIFTGVILVYGLYLLVGRFFYKRFDRRRTIYAVTDQRALILRRDGRELSSEPSTRRPSNSERRKDGVHGNMSWGTPRPAETVGDLMATRRASQWGNTYIPMYASSAGLSFWDVKDFDSLVKAARVASARHSP